MECHQIFTGQKCLDSDDRLFVAAKLVKYKVLMGEREEGERRGGREGGEGTWGEGRGGKLSQVTHVSTVHVSWFYILYHTHQLETVGEVWASGLQ